MLTEDRIKHSHLTVLIRILAYPLLLIPSGVICTDVLGPAKSMVYWCCQSLASCTVFSHPRKFFILMQYHVGQFKHIDHRLSPAEGFQSCKRRSFPLKNLLHMLFKYTKVLWHHDFSDTAQH